MHSIFVTGTDTDVGKTVVSAAILAIARSKGVDAVPMKPVQTGCESADGQLVAPDLEFCLATSGIAPSDEDKELMCPYRFEPACSPHLAAEQAGTAISLDHVVECYRELAKRHDVVIIEGAGGLVVPLSRDETMLGLITSFGLPTVIAARAGLGTINHSLLTISALRSAGIDIEGIVFNSCNPDGPDYIEDDNVGTVQAFGGVRIIGRLPFRAGLGSLAGKDFLIWASEFISIGEGGV